MHCRASVEQATSSLAAAARLPSRRTTAERQPASRDSPAIPLAVPTRPPAAPIKCLQPQARPAPTSAPDRASNSARRSRLNQSVIHPPEKLAAESNGPVTGLHAQAPAGVIDSAVVTGYRLDAIPESAEESSAQTVPQQDLDLLYTAGAEQFAYDSEAALMSTAATAPGAESAAPIPVPAAIAASPRAAAHASNRRLQATQSNSSRHTRAGEQPEWADQAAQRAGLLPAGAHRHTERALESRLLPEAERVSEATQPLSLLQLAEADMPKSDQQWPIQSPAALSVPKGQSRGSPSGAALQADLPIDNGAGSSGAGDHDRLEGGRANSGGAPLHLQQLQTSLVQTLTSTVEAAMAQMRSVAASTHGFARFCPPCTSSSMYTLQDTLCKTTICKTMSWHLMAKQA